MWPDRLHASNIELQKLLDRELDDSRALQIQLHIEDCADCRSRRDRLKATMGEFVEAHRNVFDETVLTRSSARAALRTRLRAAAAAPRVAPSFWKYGVYAGCAISFVLVLALVLFHFNDEARLLPNAKMTPGVIRNVSLTDLCSASPSTTMRPIPVATGQMVFGQYGIDNPPRGGYELDHLIDPELGGSDDPGNLWPQPYSTEWNARVKDALEDHLHELVCNGQLSLTTAQRDVSQNWIAAYRRYFHTDKPIVGHMAFTKDMPWSN